MWNAVIGALALLAATGLTLFVKKRWQVHSEKRAIRQEWARIRCRLEKHLAGNDDTYIEDRQKLEVRTKQFFDEERAGAIRLALQHLEQKERGAAGRKDRDAFEIAVKALD